MHISLKQFLATTGAQFTKFGLVGLSNTIVGYVTYVAFVWLGVHYFLASLISFVISVLNAFFWNNKYVFQATDERRHWGKALLKTFIAYGASGLILGSVLLVILVEWLHISPYWAPFFGLVITVPLNFLIHKYWTFKH